MTIFAEVERAAHNHPKRDLFGIQIRDWLLPSACHLENLLSFHVTVMSLGEVTVTSND